MNSPFDNPEITPFFGARYEPDGSIGLGCLSQWWQSPFVVDDTRFQTAEHFMMWFKATTFGDEGVAAQILATQSPSEAKKLGRQVASFDAGIWDSLCDQVVTLGNLAKFSQNPELLAVLLGTGETLLVEASPYDRIWGAGIGADDPRIYDTGQWLGANRLGIVLMDVRRMLKGHGASDDSGTQVPPRRAL